MNGPYIPHPAHMFYPLLFFVIGTACVLNDVNDLGVASYVIGGALVLWITIAGGLAPIIELWIEKRRQMEAARNLSLDQLSALGMTASPMKDAVNVRIVEEDRHGTYQRETSRDIPISPAKLTALSNHIINGGPFSRPALVNDRGLFTDPEYRNLQDALKMRGIIAPKNPGNVREGYEVTRAGLAFFRSVTEVPSPTPRMETAENAA